MNLVSGRAFGRLALLLALSAPLAAPAADPASGSVTDEQDSTGWTGGPYIVPNVTPQLIAEGVIAEPVCEEGTELCDVFRFEVNLSETDPENDEVIVSIQWADANADYDQYLYDDETGELLVDGAGSGNPESMFVPLRGDNTYNGKYRVVIIPFLPIAATYEGTVRRVSYAPPAVQKASVVEGGPAFEIYSPPKSFIGYPADEPTLDFNRQTGHLFMLYNLRTLRTIFDDGTSPAQTQWDDVTNGSQAPTTADPLMIGDEHPLPDGTWSNRIWVTQLGAATSFIAISDDEGTTWTKTQGGGQPHGVDHQSMASGPYPAELADLAAVSELGGGKGHALYYCSQSAVNAFCSRSDTGGLTWNNSVPIWYDVEVSHIGGHVKVGCDGTVYQPKGKKFVQTDERQGIAISTDAGLTWHITRVPGSAPSRHDPSIAIANDCTTVYYGFANEGDDRPQVVKGTLNKSGTTPTIDWDPNGPVDVGAALGLANMVFPTMVAGDPDRAAFAFHGTTRPGNSGDQNFPGIWYLYVAMTYDGGATWEIQNLSGENPTQRGGVCTAGPSCPSNPPFRNLLDFMDMVIDQDGRVVVGYADGCIRNCELPGGKPTYSDQGGIARQSDGLPLFSANDAKFVGVTGEGLAPLAPLVTARALHNTVHLSWTPPAARGKPVLGYRVYRTPAGGLFDGGYLLPASPVSQAKPYIVDAGVVPGIPYTYHVTAFNERGESRMSPPVTASIAHASNTASGTTGDNDRPTVINDAKAEDEESACVPPGITVVEDAKDDPLSGPPEGQDTSEDIEWIAVSEPGALDNRIVFTLKVESLPEPLLPQHRWVVYFQTPDETEWYVAMSNAEGSLRYEYGRALVFDNPAAPVGQFEYVGDLEPESTHTPDGHISLVLDKAAVGGFEPGDEVAFIYSKVRTSSPNDGTSNSGLTVDDTGSGFYDVVGNESCRDKDLPVAAFDASDLTGNTPITITFDARSTYVAPGLSIASYRWDFGDGRTLETTDPVVTHTYMQEGAFRPKLRVVDSRGQLSNGAKLTLLLGLESEGDGLLGEQGSYSIFGGALPASLLVFYALCALGFRRRVPSFD